MRAERLKGMITEWATEIFGTTLCPGDKFDIKEEVGGLTEKGMAIVGIVLFIKKTIGYKAKWTDQATLDEWQEYLKRMVGDHLKFEMRSNRGKELIYTSEMRKAPDGQEMYKTLPGTVAYNYQFQLEIIFRAESKSNATPKRKTIKKRESTK